ncbi:MAG: TetR/AcrR family transcriptional regulator [Actinomycetota bacterium]
MEGTRRTQTRERILDAAYDLLGRMGVRKTTFEDIAARSGVSRQTLYRYFGSKEELIASVMDREAERFFVALNEIAPDGADLRDAIRNGILFAFDYLANHPLLSWIYEHEPSELLPHLRGHWTPILDSVRRFIEPFVIREVEEGRLDEERARIAGDWITRVTLSYLFVPGETVDVRDEEAVRRWLPTLILDGLYGSGER